jgi:adenine-specific DNA-methyltransferase
MNQLGEYCFISKGMVLNADEKKAKGEFKKKDLISNFQSEIHNKAYIEGKNIEKYKINNIRFLEWDTDRVPSKISRPTFKELYLSEKILINKLGAIRAIYDNNKLFCDQTLRILVLWKDLKEVNNRSISNAIKKYKLGNREELEEKSKNISLKYLLAIINSRMGQFLLDGIRGINNKDINPDSLRLIPIPIADKQTQEKIKDAVDSIMKNNDECSKEINSFSKWLKRTFEVELNFDYSNLDFEDFLKKIKKQNKKLNNRKTQDTIEIGC